MAARRARIEANPNDPQRAIWLAEQASDVLFELWPAQGLGLTALFGLPDDEELHQAREYARQIHELASAAEQAVGDAILKLERQAGIANDSDAMELRRALVEVERDRRIPFLRGAGALLAAELSAVQQPRRGELHSLAAQRLPPLAQQLEGTLAAKAHWMASLALLRINNRDDAAAHLRDAQAAAANSPNDLFAAQLCGVLWHAASSGPQAALDELDKLEANYVGGDPAKAFFRVLIADQRFRLNSSRADRNAAAVFGAYIALLNENLGVAREAQRAIVLERLARAWDHVGDSLPLENVPPLVTIARAEHLANAPNTREQAIVLLEGMLPQANVSSADRAAALFALGRALHEHGRALFAAQRFIELAELHAADVHAERAIEIGASLAADLVRRSPRDVEARELLARSLHVLLGKYPNLPSIDRWRYTAGRLAMDAGQFDLAIERFAQVTPAASQWLDANFMQAAAASAKAAQLDHESGEELSPTEQQQRASAALDRVQRVRPILTTGLSRAHDESRAADVRYYLAKLKVIEAESLLALNRAGDAIGVLAGIENEIALGGEVIGEALRVRIAAHQALGRPENALRDLEQIVHAQPRQAGTVLVSMLSALERDMRAMIDADRESEARELAQRAAVPAAELLADWLDSPGAVNWPRDQRDVAAAALAFAFRVGGQFEAALRWYDEALRASPEALDLLVGRAECLFHLGSESQLGQAMELYRRIGAAGPQIAGDDYWLAQIRMLQILDRVGRNTQQILPRIERLRQQQANLGGDRFRREFEALRRKYID